MILDLLGAERIGIKLSDEYQLHPEQSTSAIVILHPKAKYFSV
jgi:5-methyltetrahydrofolate--homocysteine methyltransferase